MAPTRDERNSGRGQRCAFMTRMSRSSEDYKCAAKTWRERCARHNLAEPRITEYVTFTTFILQNMRGSLSRGEFASKLPAIKSYGVKHYRIFDLNPPESPVVIGCRRSRQTLSNVSRPVANLNFSAPARFAGRHRWHLSSPCSHLYTKHFRLQDYTYRRLYVYSAKPPHP
jgi:hypothetical protein